jgi:RHS repeat-associated protein
MMRRSLLILFACVASVPTLVAQPVEKVNWTAGVPYTYDGTGNLATIGSDEYVYDDVGRLVQAEVNAVKRNYTYDAFGNRTSCTQADPATDCQYPFSIDSANNRIAEATYDKGIPNGPGNVTTFLQHGYSYDALNVMTSDNALQFIYTADDERIATYVSGAGGGGWRWTIRDAANKVLREFTSRNGSGGFGKDGWAWGRDYVWRDGALLASRQPENNATTTYHYHTDHLGTPRQITDDKDLTVGYHDYFAFGPETNNGKTEPSATSLKYTGHERDGQDPPYSLDYMHARYYNNSLGRFLSVDPMMDLKKTMRNPQMWNRYAYVVNNPMGYTDPDGREHVQEPGFTKPMTAENLDLQSAPWYIKASFRIPGEILLAGAGEGLVTGLRGMFAMVRFAAEERLVIQEAATILRSAALRDAIAALRAGKDGATFVVGNYEIVASTELEAAAMTFRGMTGSTTFLLGEQALTSNVELIKTILHETFRLLMTPAGEATVDSAPALAKAAWSFAEGAAELFGNLRILP